MALAIPAVTISAALAGLAALGQPTEPLLASAGVRREQLDEPFAVVPDAAFDRLWMAALTHDPDPTLPVRAGLATPLGAFGVLDHLVSAAHTLGEAMHTLALFFRLVSATITLDVTNSEGGSLWINNNPAAPTDPLSDAWTLALLVGRIRALAEPFGVREVALAQPASAADNQYSTLFQTSVVFGQPRAGLRLMPDSWRAPLRSANPALYATLHALASRADIQTFVADPLQYVLGAQLDTSLEAGQVSVATIAAQLGISVRTLQRRLANEQVSFQQLLDAHRQERAMELLQEGSQTLGAIAYELGYSEQSAFNRAFKRWTGMSPRKWADAQRR
jgi:AraC-like DNA-binding protein